ncbi:hypothetical protein HPB51_020013 [Rhipicephalus microplus]|uniref:Uncharacterized protein n=1 Tax=Rhipicephalus microplus TaxID=6941 RepID=A0A9J6E3P8_RHIMP|nr:hypothetical protein HPB51_020013 [Rhipicephalus microplus]
MGVVSSCSEGKLTTTEQRLSVLTAIGEVSCHVVTGASHIQQLSEIALRHLLAVLKAEVHEGTLLLTLKMMSKWCSRFTQEPPSFLVTGCKEGMEQKTATSAVRYGYLQCMNSAFHGMPGCKQVEPILGLVLKAAERALAQPLQPGPVCEGLAAACLLFRLQPTGSPSENKIKSMVTQLLDQEKQPFFADKFLQAASEDTHLLVLQLITRMILDHPDSCFANLKPFAVPLLRGLSHSSLLVRQSTQSTVRKLVSVLSGTSLACFLLREFSSFVDSHLKDKLQTGLGHSCRQPHLHRVRAAVPCLVNLLRLARFTLNLKTPTMKTTTACTSVPVNSSDCPTLSDENETMDATQPTLSSELSTEPRVHDTAAGSSTGTTELLDNGVQKNNAVYYQRQVSPNRPHAELVSRPR